MLVYFLMCEINNRIRPNYENAVDGPLINIATNFNHCDDRCVWRSVVLLEVTCFLNKFGRIRLRSFLKHSGDIFFFLLCWISFRFRLWLILCILKWIHVSSAYQALNYLTIAFNVDSQQLISCSWDYVRFNLNIHSFSGSFDLIRFLFLFFNKWLSLSLYLSFSLYRSLSLL